MQTKITSAIALAGLERLHADAEQRAKLLSEVVRTRGNLRSQEEMFAGLLAKRRREVERAEAAAVAAGIELPQNTPSAS